MKNKTILRHYVYKITNNNPIDERKYYIGVRSCECENPLNDNYWGSSKHLKESINTIGIEHFSKEILSVWKTRDEANQEEIRLHHLFDVSNNESFYNKANATSTGFCTIGKVNVVDVNDGCTKQVTKKEFDNNDCYISYTTGLVSVYDTVYKKNRMVTKEEYMSQPTYVSRTKGFVNVKDTVTGKTKQVTKKEFDDNINFVSTTEGFVTKGWFD